MSIESQLKRVIVGLIVVAWLAPSVTAQVDTINTFAGRAVRGSVEQVDPESISVVTSEGTVRVDPWTARRIRFGDEPNELTRAKTGYADDRFNDCLQELDRITDSQAKPIVRQEIDFYRAAASARISLAGGSTSSKQAAAIVSQFLTSHPQSFHVIPATDLLGDLNMIQGLFEEAYQQYSRVSASAWPELSFLATLKSAQALLHAGKFDDAINQLAQVEAADNAEDYALRAKLVAKCLRAQALGGAGKAEQGAQLALEIIKSEDHNNRPLFARAYNALGACYLSNGETKKARDAYLHTDLLFHTEPDAHAEALFNLFQIWNQLDRADRAGEVRDKIRDRYRNTFWASKLG